MDYNSVQRIVRENARAARYFQNDPRLSNILERDTSRIIGHTYGSIYNLHSGYGLSGLGDMPGSGSNTPEIEGGIQAAASLIPIPGVGQAVGAIMGLMNQLFGWGDSTPIEDLYSKVIELRLQLAEANHAAGIQDTFHIPTGVTDNTDGGGWNVLALFIVNDYLHGVPSETLADDTDWNYEHVHGQELISHYNPEVRNDLYKTIAILENQLTSVGSNAANQQLLSYDSQGQLVQGAGATPTPGTAAPNTGTATPSGTPSTPMISLAQYTPEIIFGAGFLLLLMMAGKKGSSNE